MEWDNISCYVPSQSERSKKYQVTLGQKFFQSVTEVAQYTCSAQQLHSGAKKKVQQYQVKLVNSQSTSAADLNAKLTTKKAITVEQDSQLALLNSKSRTLPILGPQGSLTNEMPLRFKYTTAVSCTCNQWRFRLVATWQPKDELEKESQLRTVTVKALKTKVPARLVQRRQQNKPKHKAEFAAAVSASDINTLYTASKQKKQAHVGKARKCKHMLAVDAYIKAEKEKRRI